MTNILSTPFFRQIMLGAIFLIASSSVFAQQPSHSFTKTGTTGSSFLFGTTSARKTQLLYTPAELSGAIAGNITTIYFMYHTTTAQSFSHITISMKQTSATSFTTSSFETGLTKVYEGALSIPAGTAGEWFAIELQTPFPNYDPSMSLVIETKWDTSPSNTAWNTRIGSSDPTSTNRKIYDDLTSSATGTRTTSRQNFGFDVVNSSSMTYTSSTATQDYTRPALRGINNQQILGVQVVMNGAVSPKSLTQLVFSTNGTTSTADISNAKVYYTGTNSEFSTSSQFGTAISSPSGTFTFNGTQQLEAGTNYFWLSYDIPASAGVGNTVDAELSNLTVGNVQRTPSVTAPTGKRTVRDAMTGTYTVGAGGTYPTLSAAIADVLDLALKGNVTLDIISNISETQRTTIAPWDEVNGSAYSLTIRPSGGPRIISGNISGVSTDHGVIKIDGADRVTIDGRINGSGNFLSIENSNTGSYSAAIMINSRGAGAGSDNVTIRNLNLKAGINTSSTSYGISVRKEDNDNLTIQGNNISKAYYGIYILGVSANPNNNVRILENSIGSENSSEYIYTTGIDLGYTPGVIVSRNKIFNIIKSASGDISAIDLSTNSTDAVISYNRIYNIKQEYSSGAAAYGINIASAAADGAKVFNNFIGPVYSYGNGTLTDLDNAIGIRVIGGDNHKIYFNTVLIEGTFGSTVGFSAGLGITTTTALTGLEIKNNIFANTMSSSGTPGSTQRSFGIYARNASSLAGSDYNNYYVSGNTAAVAYVGTAVQNTLANLQSVTTGDDNSKTSPVLFLDKVIGDLHLADANTSLTGTAIPGYSSDMDNELRTRHYMGADEVNPVIANVVSPELGTVICDGGQFTLSAGANLTFADNILRPAAQLSYRWELNGKPVEGETGATLTRTARYADSGLAYRAIIRYLQDSVFTGTATPNIQAPASIRTHPLDASICQGDPTVELDVQTSGTINGFRWQKDQSGTGNGPWLDINGQTNRILMLPSNIGSRGYYRLAVTTPGICGPGVIYTNPARVSVAQPITMSSDDQPDPETVCVGETASLSISASGTIFDVKWQKNGIDIDAVKNPSATTFNLVIPAAQVSDAGEYRAVLSGTCQTPTFTTNAVRITVNSPLSLTSQPQSQVICTGENVYLTATTRGTVFSYRWQKDGQDIDTLHNPSAKTAILQLSRVDNNASAKYRVLVTGSPECGTGTIISEQATIFVSNATQIVNMKPLRPVALGGSIMLTADVTGINAKSRYQWYRGNTPLADNQRISGSRASLLIINNIQQSDLDGKYRLVVQGVCGQDSTEFSLFVPNITIDSNPADLALCDGQEAVFTIEAKANSGSSLKYRWLKNGQPVADGSGYSGALSKTLRIANVSSDDAASYSVEIMMEDGTAIVSSLAALTVNRMPEITGIASPATACEGKEIRLIPTLAQPTGATYTWFRDDVQISASPDAELVIASAAASDAARYRLVVSNNCGADTMEQSLTITTKPVISQQPGNTSIVIGAELKLSVNAQGAGTLGYQWIKDGAEIAGANSADYTVASATTDLAGTYRVRISNECGETLSDEAKVDIVSGVNEIEGAEIAVLDNAPNPFSAATEIRITLPRSTQAKLVISDIYGREIARLLDGRLDAGTTKLLFDATGYDIPSGTYYYTLSIGKQMMSRKMLLVK